MENRKTRPQLPSEISLKGDSDAEDFQNKVLRPIIKMQSDLLIAHLYAKLKTLKITLKELDPLKQKDIITQLFSKDQSFKHEIIGMIIGQFSFEEYECYSKISKETNRRITQIVSNRCVDLLIDNYSSTTAP